jgi:hypothetical protein
MKLDFCDRWLADEKRPLHSLTEKEARQRHSNREPYVVIAGKTDRPDNIVEVGKESVYVTFLDRLMREYLAYDFREIKPGKLFLKMAISWEYRGSSDEVSSSKHFSFDGEGHVLMADKDHRTGEIRKLETTVSVEENWDDFPKFGNYEQVCVKERLPRLPQL